MIGKLIGALVGKRASRHIEGVNETGGALLGAAAVPVIRRLGPLGLVAMAAGGYAFMRHQEKKAQVAASPRPGSNVGAPKRATAS